MTNWNADEHGNRTFTYNGWTVRIWEKSITYRINIDSPHRGEEVEVEIRDKKLKAKVVKYPFVRNGKVLV